MNATRTIPERLWTRDYLLITFSTISVYLGFHSLNPTLPLYIKSLGGTTAVAGAALGLLAISALAIRPVSGRLLDAGRRKRVLALGLLLFLVPTLAYPWVGSIALLLGWRFVQGLGWGVASTAATTVAADVIPKSRLGEGMGFFSLTSTVALAVAPAASFWVAARFGFPALFSCGVVVTGLSLALALAVRAPDAPRPDAGLRPALFEPRALRPALVILCVTVTYASLLSFLALFAQERGPGGAGAFFTASAFCTLFARPLSGRLADRRGSDVVVVPGLLLIVAAMAILSCTGSLAGLLAAGVTYGAGFGAVLPALLALSLRAAPPERRGAATSTYWAAFDLGITAGSLLWGSVSEALGYEAMFLCNAVPGALALVVYLELGRREKRAAAIAEWPAASGAPPEAA